MPVLTSNFKFKDVSSWVPQLYKTLLFGKRIQTTPMTALSKPSVRTKEGSCILPLSICACRELLCSEG